MPFRALSLVLAACLANAATLEKLTLDEMIEKSTAIVRGRVLAPSTSVRGSVLYTHFPVEVLEQWKGQPARQAEVMVPGGSRGSLHQHFPGAPSLVTGKEYVLFLWTGRSGAAQVIGFTQGVFDIRDSAGEPTAHRAASSEALVDLRTGRMVRDEPLQMKLAELRARVGEKLAGGATR